MKIIMENEVYVQKNDLGFMNHTQLAIPASIFMKVFGNGVTIIDDSNRYEFVRFDEKSEIDFFKEQDWIVDYNSVKDLSEEEIKKIFDETVNQMDDISEKYNKMSSLEQANNSHMAAQYERLEFKLYSLRDILWFKQGHLEISLPDGIDYPEGYEKQKLKGIKKALNKLQNKISKK